ncbi:MAG: diacylglycerol kinase family protein [Candidatus Doudnabacteria bacterium]|nr:diacylglycerol kinase family protein [Candidatus Doudnabacteria bacterium]
MYYYILDQNGLPLEKFERLQTEVSGLLAEFKITGETARVTPLRSIQDLVDTASQRGAKTLVACGSDDTFNLMLAALKGRDFTLGFIPFDETSFLSKILGIDNVFTGVKTIAGRRMEKIDLAKIAGNFFINYLEFGITSHNLKNLGWFKALKLPAQETKSYVIRIDDSYNLNITALGGLAINIRATSSKEQNIGNPMDSNLDLLILEKLSKTQILRYKDDLSKGTLENIPNTTVIKCKKIQFLEPRGTSLTMLGRVVAKFPSVVEIIPQRLRLIVGKNRTF